MGLWRIQLQVDDNAIVAGQGRLIRSRRLPAEYANRDWQGVAGDFVAQLVFASCDIRGMLPQNESERMSLGIIPEVPPRRSASRKVEQSALILGEYERRRGVQQGSRFLKTFRAASEYDDFPRCCPGISASITMSIDTCLAISSRSSPAWCSTEVDVLSQHALGHCPTVRSPRACWIESRGAPLRRKLVRCCECHEAPSSHCASSALTAATSSSLLMSSTPSTPRQAAYSTPFRLRRRILRALELDVGSRVECPEVAVPGSAGVAGCSAGTSALVDGSG